LSGFCEHSNEILGFTKCGEFTSLGEELSASPEGLCSKKLVMHQKCCGMRLYPNPLLETVVSDVTRDVTALFLAIMDGVSHIQVVSFSAWRLWTKK